ncbi:MAG: diguanylate cyclase [Roseibium sp.]
MTKPIPTNKDVETAQQIDALLDSHRKWVDRLNKCLICKIPPAEDLTATDAHKLCSLGTLLESRDQDLFPDKETYNSIYELHKTIHKVAQSMVLDAQSDKQIDANDYDDFLNKIKILQNFIEGAYDTIVDTINTTDPLTGAQNRAQMPGLLEERISETKNGVTSWVLMVDLDHFKSVNDQYGHEVGDRVLEGFATVVRDHIRTNDLFFRYGGEEFLICVSGVTRKMITRVADRLRVAISKEAFDGPSGETITVTASFGVTQLMPDVCAKDAINAADLAMYAAKHAGRNKVVFESELSGGLPS